MKWTPALLTAFLLPCFTFGQIGFKKSYGDPSTHEAFSKIVPAAGSGFVIAGETGIHAGKGDDFWLVRTDAVGIKLWENNYGNSRNENLYAMIATPGGGFLLAGGSQLTSDEHFDAWLVKTDANGVSVWEKSFPDDYENWIADIRPAPGGGYAALQNYYLPDGSPLSRLIKLGNSGAEEWALDFSTGDFSRGIAVVPAPDGSFFVFGNTVDNQAKLAKVTAGGSSIEWSKTYLDETDLPGAILTMEAAIATPVTGGFLFSGFTNNASLQTKINADGSVSWQNFVNSGVSEMLELPDGKVFILQSFNGNAEIFEPGGNSAEVLNFQGTPLSVCLGGDGVPALAGSLRNDGLGTDGLLTLLDPNFQETNLLVFGDDEPFDVEDGWSVRQTSDNGYIMAGIKYIDATFTDCYVVKADTEGNMEWEAGYAYPGNENCFSIDPAPGGGFLLSGRRLADSGAGLAGQITLRKIDENGTELWFKAFDYSGLATAHAQTMPLPDGSIMMTYATGTPRRPYLMKLSPEGDSLWTKIIGTTEQPRHMILTSDNAVLVTGWITNLNAHGFLIKTDLNGNVLFNFPFSGGNGISYGLEEVNDGYLVSGFTDTDDLNPDSVFIAKIGLSGGLEWEKLYSTGADSHARPLLTKSADGNFFIVTSTSTSQAPQNFQKDEIYLLKVNEAGDLLETRFFDESARNSIIRSARLTSDGGLALFGITTVVNTVDYYLIKTDQNGAVSSFSIKPFGKLLLSPNPSPGQLSIQFESEMTGMLSIEIFDLNGRLLRQWSEEKPGLVFQRNYDLESLSGGICQVRLMIGGKHITRSWVKL